MALEKKIETFAREDLTFRDDRGQEDIYLWEHTQRVVRIARWVAALPQVAGGEFDSLALLAAGYYHDVGWMVQLREQTIARTEVLARPTSDLQRELSASLLEARLGSFLPPATLHRAAQTVRDLNNRHSDQLEVQVLSDAANLNQVGALSVWHLVRRHVSDGKAVQAAVDTWRRQREYRFWEARIKDAFHFEPVRELAYRRLETFDRFMAELEHQHNGEDLTTTPADHPASQTTSSWEVPL